MRIPGWKRAKHVGRWLRSRFVRGALILGYHRVAAVPHDPYGLCVSPRHFAEQLAVLRRWTNPTRLPQLIQDLQRPRLLRRTVVLTFDDGYADTHAIVQPLLEQYEIPATVFITTGYLGRAFWWDELQRLVFAPETLPDRLSLPMNGSTFTWPPARVPVHKAGGDPRKDLLLSLYRRVLPLSDTARAEVLARLWDWAGSASEDPPLCRALTEKELVRLSSSDLLDIGAHSETHPLLSRLPISAQRREVEQSKRHLEALIRRPVTVFSYPNGSSSEATEQVVRDAGYIGACGSEPGVVRAQSNRFSLPRFWVTNQDGAAFSRWLKTWLTG